MNRKLVLTLSMLVLTAALLFSLPAAADSISITLASPYQNGHGNTTVSFTATVAAPGSNSVTIYLNSDSYGVDAPLSVDDTGFLVNFPLTMDPGDSVTDVLFTVFVAAGTPPGLCNGYFQILGGSDANAQNAISNLASFRVNVVPEPGSLLLLASGVLGLFGVARRKLS